MKILVGGIGNIFRADDGFGVAVAQRLARRRLPPNVEVVDFGIRAFDLAYVLLDRKHEWIYLVDLVHRGQAPGTLYVIEPEADESEPAQRPPLMMDLVAQTHGMDPAKVLAWVKASGGELRNLRLIGCEPADLGAEDEVSVGLSPPVEAAVDEAVRMIEELICTSLASPQTC